MNPQPLVPLRVAPAEVTLGLSYHSLVEVVDLLLQAQYVLDLRSVRATTAPSLNTAWFTTVGSGISSGITQSPFEAVDPTKGSWVAASTTCLVLGCGHFSLQQKHRCDTNYSTSMRAPPQNATRNGRQETQAVESHQ